MRFSMPRSRLSHLWGLMVLLVPLLFVATPTSTASAQEVTTTSAGTTFTVMAGFDDIDAKGLAIESFLPTAIFVNEGDTVTWMFSPFEPHSVTFLSGADAPEEFIPLDDGRLAFNPEALYASGGMEYDGTGVVNSGIVVFDPEADPTYSLTFTATGNFDYLCLIHPQMTGTVTVVPSGAFIPLGQAGIDSLAQTQKQGLIAGVESLDSAEIEPVTNDDGTSSWELLAGISSAKVDLMHFRDPEITVATGDTVSWSLAMSGAPHTVTFLPMGEEGGPPILVEPTDGGPPNIILDPKVMTPTGGDAYLGDGFYNSGLMFPPAFAPPGAPTDYSLTFTQPGTFMYFCWLHAPQGMVGTITVEGEPTTEAVGTAPTESMTPDTAAGGPIGPGLPSVGGLAPNSLMAALAVVLGLGLVLTGGLMIRRRNRV